MAEIRIGPARVPSRDSAEEAVRLLQERRYTAGEIDCEGGLSTGKPMVPPWAPSLLRPASDPARAPAGQSPAPPPNTTSRSCDGDR